MIHNTYLVDWLTLIGIGGDTFISLPFLDQVLLAEFLTKISKLFCRWKLTWIGLIWCLAKLIESYKKCLQKKGATNEHFPCFYSSCQIGPGLIPSFILTAYSFACCSASGPLNCTESTHTSTELLIYLSSCGFFSSCKCLSGVSPVLYTVSQ